MMHHASSGMRSALRKGTGSIIHSGPGSGTTRGSSRLFHINTLDAIRPRSPSHRLFTISKNLFQKFITHLTAPGLRSPTHFAQNLQTGTRSLHNATFRRNPIQNGFSLAARASLEKNALNRQATIFLPRAPNRLPPRLGGATHVGLGTVRNFTTGRPIFQQMVENIPIAGRTLYEIDLDMETRQKRASARIKNAKKPKTTTMEMCQPTQRIIPITVNPTIPDLDHYFPAANTVTTHLHVPLAPILQQNPVPEDLTFLPQSDLFALHNSYTTHRLRVHTLFTRLEQANVWSRGVSSSSYSQDLSDWNQHSGGEAVCTNLQLTFDGWTEAEVRSVIGESGTGWCSLEEIWHDQDLEKSDTLSSISDSSELSSLYSPALEETLDSSDLFIMPTLAFSSSFLSSISDLSSSFEDLSVNGLTNGDLNEDLHPSLSRSTSYSDLVVGP